MFGAKDFQKKGRAYVQRTLRTVLDRVGATDMVIGHTPQASCLSLEFRVLSSIIVLLSTTARLLQI